MNNGEQGILSLFPKFLGRCLVCQEPKYEGETCDDLDVFGCLLRIKKEEEEAD